MVVAERYGTASPTTPVTDLVMFGTGNGTPGDSVRRDAGGGDNLFMTSIVALHASDGSYAWHYQPTPWETWDYDTGQQLMLLEMPIDGKQRRVVMQASKNGFFYVLDAATESCCRPRLSLT